MEKALSMMETEAWSVEAQKFNLILHEFEFALTLTSPGEDAWLKCYSNLINMYHKRSSAVNTDERIPLLEALCKYIETYLAHLNIEDASGVAEAATVR